jgi:thiamine-phosphate pyrophosphorylase
MSRSNNACRLYLVLPPAMTSRVADVSRVLQAADIPCLLLTGKPETIGDDVILRMMHCAQSHDTAFLLQDDAETVKRLGADGIHLDVTDTCRDARNLLGNGAIIGADCGLSRHLAMTLAEQGADYVTFGGSGGQENETSKELIAWWAELFEVPCVAWGVETIEEATFLANAGADFVALSPAIWNSESPTHAIQGFQAALAATGQP